MTLKITVQDSTILGGPPGQAHRDPEMVGFIKSQPYVSTFHRFICGLTDTSLAGNFGLSWAWQVYSL